MTSDDTTNDGASTHRRRRPRTRRSVLALGAAGLSAGVSGCSAIRGDLPGIGSSDSSVFEEISFEGQHMVVQLREGHSVKRVNLIAPEGTKFASKRVADGVSRIEITVLSVSPQSGDYEHYRPGAYTLVASKGDETEKRSIELQPDLVIVGVSAYRNPKFKAVQNVSVTVKNKGTAPTWVFDISYPNAPNQEAREHGDNPGVPEVFLKQPEDALKTVVPPRGQQTFVSTEPPFRFQESTVCSGGERETEVIVHTPTEGNIRRPLQATFSGGIGEKQSTAGQEHFVCENGAFSIRSEGDGS